MIILKQPSWGYTIFYSVLILTLGIVVSVASGDWSVLVFVAVLVVLMLGALGLRAAKSREE
jgi:uncharacterized membrane protein